MMTATDLRAWMTRLGLDREAAAEALGVSKRTIDAYVRPTEPKPIPRPIALLCGYIERDHTAARRQAAIDDLRALLSGTPA